MDLSARGNVTDYLNAKKKEVEKFQAALKSGTFKTNAEMAKSFNAFNKTVLDKAKWQELVVNQGKFGAGLTLAKDKIEAMNAAFSGVRNASAAVFATSTGAILGLSAAASPDAINTFKGSLQLLAGEAGKSFIPFMAEASKKIQDLQQELKDTDESTKNTAATWVLWTAGITAGLAGLGVAGAVLSKVATGATMVATGFKAMTGAATVAGGIGAAIAAPATGVAAILGGVLVGQKYREWQLGSQMEEGNRSIQNIRDRKIDTEDYQQSEARKRVMAAAPQDRASVAQKTAESYQTQIEELNKENAAKSTFGRGIDALLGSQAKLQARKISAFQNLETAKLVKQEVDNGRTPEMLGRPGSPYIASQQKNAAGFVGIEDLHKMLQMQIYSKDPMEAAIDRQQREADQVFLKEISANTKVTADKAVGMRK